ncbi:MAG: Asp-tRNA(Asn)/Glu-tRNA(Gln) amidotransferase subunit GatC [Candidatus Sumerlaeia bacterium]
MSHITPEQVRHVALLSRLALTDAELDRYTRELRQILDYMEKLQELDTTSVEPMAHAIRLCNVLAEDLPSPGLTPAEAVANAPEAENDCFKVPRVIQQMT